MKYPCNDSITLCSHVKAVLSFSNFKLYPILFVIAFRSVVVRCLSELTTHFTHHHSFVKYFLELQAPVLARTPLHRFHASSLTRNIINASPWISWNPTQCPPSLSRLSSTRCVQRNTRYLKSERAFMTIVLLLLAAHTCIILV